MKQITEKENFMMFIHGEQPLWVPRYGMAADKYSKYPPAVLPVTASFLNARRTPEGGFDTWGVPHIATAETGGAALPVPNNFLITDITKWRDIVRAPDMSRIDWASMAKKDLADIDRENTAVVGTLHVGYFQQLMAFMGFSEGLCAMFEEPDEVKALFQYMADFFVEVTKKMIEYYKPDLIELTDDTAAAKNPFISIDMYRELIKPYHYQQTKPAVDAGIPVIYHNCGRCEDFIPDWFDLSIVAWNPAQIMNDLDGIKKRYGNKLGLIGCWDSSGPAGWDSASEELIKGEVRKTIDRFAPGGGFCFWGSAYGPATDPRTDNRKRWLTEEYEAYGRTFYNK
ncbi:Uroporphyrinogen decarboxylase (URO-D) [Sporobacter termitidis DSM 10068]|uniref:Uroporphyrinogen decarboxylase (URO-D) n=1 Tax=Sporobacter termitidis DSM 10068 TaxID=1123282 RepID=A0A1M5YLS5_9FIRM|nr:uroporphyrinogen decarboxylase family protein [Sporobacter termitidis]SHI12901.1 Uroporphyrinogen decarboxylase (URO-D) [Sporobacter termitidis DSM 10068]